MAPVHPRVCGEQFADRLPPISLPGSSPRVRGTVSSSRWPSASRRFIPACAGNSRSGRCSWRSRPVHPRVCGEQRRRCRAEEIDDGSSPRVRGTGCCFSIITCHLRFIPACAGNSVNVATAWVGPPVHPRVCGEQSLECLEGVHPDGSSPRVRGTDGPPPRRQCQQRFIPACAGNRAASARTARR